jgi:oxepin-CoA hydrolase/3-oxo-5,6-dehydrosuberyl-CoA semialdehyde dehydrogenase
MTIEAFGPVSTLIPYDGVDEAIAAGGASGQGSLVCSAW